MVRLSGVRALELAEISDPDEMAGVVPTGNDPTVAPLFDVDAIKLELVCFGISGISMPLPFWIVRGVTIAFSTGF